MAKGSGTWVPMCAGDAAVNNKEHQLGHGVRSGRSPVRAGGAVKTDMLLVLILETRADRAINHPSIFDNRSISWSGGLLI